jgi:glutamyl-tRNA synthetase
MLNEVPKMLKFLFTKKFVVDAESVSKITDDGSKAILQRSIKELETVSDWNHTNIEAVLRASLIEEMALKPRIAFTALRIATTGSTISPPLFESMELLGKEACLLRINAGLAL